MKGRLSKIFVAAEPSGRVELLQHLAEQAVDAGADAIALLGTLAPRTGNPKLYGDLLKAVAAPKLAVYYIPGPEDVPFASFLREAASFEIVLPNIQGVQSTFAVAAGRVVFAGIGGNVLDDPACLHDEMQTLRYPGWEVEYRLKFLKELKDYEKVFLFTTPPEHKGLYRKGSSALAEVVKTYNPRLVLVSGKERDEFTLGSSLVVCPGSLTQGHFTLIHYATGEAKPGILRDFVRAA